MSDKAKRERIQAIVSGGTKTEPTVTESSYRTDLMLALNWYNAFRDGKDIRT